MFTLPDLPYSFNALEPYIDEETMRIHHDKHHNAYINKLNEAIKNTQYESYSVIQLLQNIATLPENLQIIVRNHGGGHANHSLFWNILCPAEKSSIAHISASFEHAINQQFQSFSQFQALFHTTALNQFGSGWAWLVAKPDKTLAIYSTPNQDNPYIYNDIPLLGIDVWEHAYYLHYQNRRADYLQQIFSIINWDVVNNNYTLI